MWSYWYLYCKCIYTVKQFKLHYLHGFFKTKSVCKITVKNKHLSPLYISIYSIYFSYRLIFCSFDFVNCLEMLAMDNSITNSGSPHHFGSTSATNFWHRGKLSNGFKPMNHQSKRWDTHIHNSFTGCIINVIVFILEY